MTRGIEVGDTAPDFTLPSQSGEPVRLHDRIGQRVVVLYFYPKDETSGCTAEACVSAHLYVGNWFKAVLLSQACAACQTRTARCGWKASASA
jgi:alkyl hydroperoxide reductase subunit AhpC